jgi:hypothetical protein
VIQIFACRVPSGYARRRLRDSDFCLSRGVGLRPAPLADNAER